jgi:hypothetical protein
MNATYDAHSVGAEAVRQTVARERGAEGGNGYVVELQLVKVAQPEVKVEVGNISWYVLDIEGTEWFATTDIRNFPGITATLAEDLSEVRERSAEALAQ